MTSILVQQALSATPRDAIAQLRAAGPRGMNAFLSAHAERLYEPTVAAALDAICAQRGAASSRLYWYTDLSLAQKVAREQRRPILSLRLLGRLDERESCANSRFFRKQLYAEDSVSALLRSSFVLHWQSVCPVPKIRIDFGDGRVVSYPVTGNSAHLVLDDRARPIDAIPGLYQPSSFIECLRDTLSLGSRPSPRAVARYHAKRSNPRAGRAMIPPSSRQPNALDAGPLALSKARIEMPVVRAIVPPTDDEGLFNANVLRPPIHRKLASSLDLDHEALTNWIYEHVFEMPLWDPWLGLRPDFEQAALS